MALLLCDDGHSIARESLNRAASILELPRDHRKSIVPMKVIGLSYALEAFIMGSPLGPKSG
jgi:hypothetical protein